MAFIHATGSPTSPTPILKRWFDGGRRHGKRLNNPLLSDIFPGYTVNPLGLAVPR
jgi:hypothetical protein